jgi:hypothetical protein
VSDFPIAGPETLPLFITPYSTWSIGRETTVSLSAPASSTWPVANQAYFIPLTLPWPYPVVRLWWFNGSAVTSTNMDIGIYTLDGIRLYSSGSTAESGVSAPQFVVPTSPILLTPGRYYMALACSTTTANCGGDGTTSMTVIAGRLCGMLQQASALPLPPVATFAAMATNAFIPFFGITRTPTGF